MPTNALQNVFSMEVQNLKVRTSRRAKIRHFALLAGITFVGTLWCVAVAVMVVGW
jgi:hypothetical protein